MARRRNKDGRPAADTVLPRLDGRRALVTGAGRGLGLGIAAALAAAGAARDAGCAQPRRGDGGGRCDPRRGRQRRAARARCHRSRRRAGGDRRRRAVRHPRQQCRHQPSRAVSRGRAGGFRRHLRAQCPRRLLRRPGGGASGWSPPGGPGSIINMSSQMGHVGGAGRTVYCASKHAMEGFTKAMAIELAPAGIRVNTIAPTFIETPLTAPFFEDQGFKAAVLGEDQARPARPRRGSDGRDRLPRLDASALMTGYVARRRWRLDGRQRDASACGRGG